MAMLITSTSFLDLRLLSLLTFNIRKGCHLVVRRGPTSLDIYARLHVYMIAVIVT